MSSKFARKRQENVDALAAQLIETFGIEKESENFEIAEEFVLGNLRQVWLTLPLPFISVGDLICAAVHNSTLSRTPTVTP
jgi:hypothetical protein